MSGRHARAVAPGRFGVRRGRRCGWRPGRRRAAPTSTRAFRLAVRPRPGARGPAEPGRRGGGGDRRRGGARGHAAAWPRCARAGLPRGSISALPTKTALGHAALFTGAWATATASSATRCRCPEEPSSRRRRLQLDAARAEPIWYAAARQDLDAVVVSGTQVYPFTTYTDGRRFRGYTGRRLTLFDGYQNFDARGPRDHRGDRGLEAGRRRLAPLPAHGRSPRGALRGGGVARWTPDVRRSRRPVGRVRHRAPGPGRRPVGRVALKATPPRDEPGAFRALTVPLAGGECTLFFRLYSLAPTDRGSLLYYTPPHVLRANKPRLEAAAQEATGGFVGNGAALVLRAGPAGAAAVAGRRRDGGGPVRGNHRAGGPAVRPPQRFRVRAHAVGPAGHLSALPGRGAAPLVRGARSPLPGHDPQIARRLRPYLDRVLAMVDTYVGQLVDRAGRDAIVAVGSDHGMTSDVPLLQAQRRARPGRPPRPRHGGADRPRAYPRRLLPRQLRLRPHQPAGPSRRHRAARGGGGRAAPRHRRPDRVHRSRHRDGLSGSR